MKFYICKIKENFLGNWKEAITKKQCEVVEEIEADDWIETYKLAFKLGYRDTDRFALSTINDF